MTPLAEENTIAIEVLGERYSPALSRLSRRLACNFVDARVASKDFVREIAERPDPRLQNAGEVGWFIVSTCLRHEIYGCDGSLRPAEPFFHVSGLACVRRLLSVLTGLQSEIAGEREITAQVAGAIDRAAATGRLDSTTVSDLRAACALSEQIRARSKVATTENYSTIAADIVAQNLADRRGAVLAIVGAGYMADRFFSQMIADRLANIAKLIWINRNTVKTSQSLAQLIDLIHIEVEIVDLDEGRDALSEADLVFCALAKSPELYRDIRLRPGAFIVDVSYPPVFSESLGVTLLNIANTSFTSLVRNPVPKRHLMLANREIDAVIQQVERRS